MADWRKVAMGAILADGKIEDREVKVLKTEIFADGKVSKDELEFLNEIRTKAGKNVAASFKDLFFGSMRTAVLLDDKVTAAEAKWLRKMIFADNVVDADERKFLKDLQGSAKAVTPEFTELLAECAG